MGKCAVVMQCEALIRTLLCLSEFQARALAFYSPFLLRERAFVQFYLFSNSWRRGFPIHILVMAPLNSDRATLRISGPQRKESSPEGTYPLKESA